MREMKLSPVFWVMGCLVFVKSGASAPSVPFALDPADASNPYALISERNIFHLNPIPPEPAPELPKVELPVVKFSGFYRVGRVTKALLCSLPKDKKEEPIYYDLSEGEKEGFLEVVKIHYDKGEVDVVNSGTPMTLSLKEDSLVSKQEMPKNNRDIRSGSQIPFRAFGQSLGRPGGFSEAGGNSPYSSPQRPHRSSARP
jgi:hypothetical protein